MKHIPVNQPVISKQAARNVRQALSSGWLSSAGPFVVRFENAIAKYLGVKHAVAVTSGTTALHTALLAGGIGPDDEVLVPAFTMAATWMAVIYTGAKPVFVDCELKTYNLDVSLIEKSITKKTKAIIPVHIYGHACDMSPIIKIARKYGLMVIEDAAEALGGTYHDKKCGSIGDVGCFSFYANKIVTTGEGGMVVTNDKNIAERARKYRDLCHSDKKRFIHEKLGYNFRMTNLQAAVGLGELSNINQYLLRKIRMAKAYDLGLKKIPGLALPQTLSGIRNTYWMYGIVINEKNFGLTRDQLRAALKKQNIDTRDFFYSPSEQPVLKSVVGRKRFPNAEYLSRHGLYLPSGLAITPEQIQTVIAAIIKLHQNG